MVMGAEVQEELSSKPAHSLHGEILVSPFKEALQWHRQMEQTTEQNLATVGVNPDGHPT